MSDEHKKRRVYFFILTALLAALIAYSTALEVAETENIFEIVVNNTNLAPAEVGHPGTGERITGVNYTASLYPLQLLVFSHADTAGQISEIHIFVNGTQILDISGKPLGAAEENNKSLTAIIPKDSIYMVEFSNTHHYEWREYPILSGRNGTLSINQTIISSGGTNNHSNLTNLNWSLAGHILDSDLHFTFPYQSIWSSSNISYISWNNGLNLYSEHTNISNFSYSNVIIGNNSESYVYSIVQLLINGINSGFTEIYQDYNSIVFSNNGTEKMAINSSGNITINTTLDMQNNPIINFKYIDSGSYIGDGTTNRFIPYSLGHSANKIDINSNITPIEMGMIIEPGYIYSTKSGNAVNVTPHNSTGFFVSTIYNVGGGNTTDEIGDTSSTDTTLTGYIFYFPVTPSVSGTIININLNVQTASGGIRLAIYNDSANSPFTLLNQSGNITATTGWNNLSVINSVTAGTQYWLAAQLSSNSLVAYRKVTGAFKYQSQAFGTFPTTASGLSSGTKTFNMRFVIQNPDISYYWVAI